MTSIMIKYLLMALLWIAAPCASSQTIFEYHRSTYDVLRFETIAGRSGECRLLKPSSGNKPYGYSSSSYVVPDEVTDRDTGQKYRVTEIGAEAFMGSNNVLSVELPLWLKKIDLDAFRSCGQLKEIAIPDGVTEIGPRAFMLCAKLAKVEMASRSMLATIGGEAFSGCKSLKSFTIAENVTYVGSEAFANSGIENIQFNATRCPMSGTRYQPPLSGTSGVRVTFGENVRMIPDNFFAGVKRMYSFDVPESVSEIGEAAFLGCPDLQVVRVTASVNKVGSSAFEGCVSMVESDLSSVTTLGRSVFKGCTKLAKAVLSQRLDKIPDETFMGCVALEDFAIPSTVRMIGKRAFQRCAALPLDGVALWPKNLATIDTRAFEGCALLTSLPPASARYGDYALSATGLESGKVLSTTLGKAVFADCLSLKSLSTQSGMGLTVIPDSLFAGCRAMEVMPVMSIDLESIGDEAFRDCVSLHAVDVPAGCESIGNGAFDGCTGLRAVKLNNRLSSIGSVAFRGCSSLQAIDVPDMVENIWAATFSGCSSLESVGIGCHVVSIATDAFDGCADVTHVTVTALQPPTTTDRFFPADVFASAMLYEPAERGAAYAAANGWRLFQKRTTLEPVKAVNILFEPAHGTDIQLQQGDASRIMAQVVPDNATYQALEWHSSDESVVAVDPDGTLHGLQVGEAIVTVRLVKGDVPAFVFRVYVDPKPVAMIFIDEESVELTEGDTRALAAAVYPANATDRRVEWRSSDESVVTVSADGLLTALVPGEAVVTVAALDGSGVEVSCDVKVLKRIIPVAGVTLDVSEMELIEGDTHGLSAIVTPDDATDNGVDWSSTDESVAVVAADGTVTAVAPGMAEIKATAHDGFGQEAVCRVTVKRRIISVEEVALTANAAECTEGDEIEFALTYGPSDATEPEVEWSVSDPEMARMISPGRFLIMHPGEVIVTVTVTTPDGVARSASATVKASPRIYLVATIVLSSEEVELTEGETMQLTAAVTPDNATDSRVSWAVSDAHVATVSESGLIEALAEGSAVVTASAIDGSGVVAECRVKVVAAPVVSGIRSPWDGMTDGAETVTVSDLAGRIVYSGRADGLKGASLPHGYYIVATPRRVVKVLIR